MKANKAVFFDRDGVLNYDSPDYVYEVEKYRLFDDVAKTLGAIKNRGYHIFVVTNQAGISKGLYTRAQMKACNNKLFEQTGGIIDRIFYSPYHPSITKSLSRKPGTLLFQRAIALYSLDPDYCWMVGDRDSDLLPAVQLGINVIGVKRREPITATEQLVENLSEISELII